MGSSEYFISGTISGSPKHNIAIRVPALTPFSFPVEDL